MRAVASNFGSGQHDLEAEVAFNLVAHLLQQIAKKFLNLSAAETDYVSMFLLETRLVIMLVAIVMRLTSMAAEMLASACLYWLPLKPQTAAASTAHNGVPP